MSLWHPNDNRPWQNAIIMTSTATIPYKVYSTNYQSRVRSWHCDIKLTSVASRMPHHYDIQCAIIPDVATHYHYEIHLSASPKDAGGLQTPPHSTKKSWDVTRTCMWVDTGKLHFCRKVAVAILTTIPVTQNAYASTYCTSLNCKDADITRKTVHQLAVAL